MPIGNAEKGQMMYVTSLVSQRTRESVVEFQWGENKAQLSVEEARRYAFSVIECAEAAETDAFIVKFFMEELKMEQGKALQALVTFRSFREQRNAEKRQ